MLPKSSHKQAGKCPAFVVSPAAYNGKVGLSLLCPVSSRIRGCPFEVAIPRSLPVKGVILTDQVKSIDWQTRQAVFRYLMRHWLRLYSKWI
ncbi:type II toxin-antitoxin system PemK/MazF family toxin [Cohnella algarum]|uniref:type II toxin-antitoxin system PemK/MazF family toxin n=1 Tax=Cohnella algarum TaxID=2044859 RepID=UPI00308446DA